MPSPDPELPEPDDPDPPCAAQAASVPAMNIIIKRLEIFFMVFPLNILCLVNFEISVERNREMINKF